MSDVYVATFKLFEDDNTLVERSASLVGVYSDHDKAMTACASLFADPIEWRLLGNWVDMYTHGESNIRNTTWAAERGVRKATFRVVKATIDEQPAKYLTREEVRDDAPQGVDHVVFGIDWALGGDITVPDTNTHELLALYLELQQELDALEAQRQQVISVYGTHMSAYFNCLALSVKPPAP